MQQWVKTWIACGYVDGGLDDGPLLFIISMAKLQLMSSQGGKNVGAPILQLTMWHIMPGWVYQTSH